MMPAPVLRRSAPSPCRSVRRSASRYVHRRRARRRGAMARMARVARRPGRSAAAITARSSVSSRDGTWSAEPGQYAPRGACEATKVIEFTDWAVQILHRSHEAARRFNPNATVRVFRKGSGVEFALVDEPQDGDQVVERD